MASREGPMSEVSHQEPRRNKLRQSPQFSATNGGRVSHFVRGDEVCCSLEIIPFKTGSLDGAIRSLHNSIIFFTRSHLPAHPRDRRKFSSRRNVHRRIAFLGQTNSRNPLHLFPSGHKNLPSENATTAQNYGQPFKKLSSIEDRGSISRQPPTLPARLTRSRASGYEFPSVPPNTRAHRGAKTPP